MSPAEAVFFLIPIVAIVAFSSYMIVQSIMRSRVRELEIRERISMIEKGLVPPPEVNPGGFDRAMARHDRERHYDEYDGGRRNRDSALRHRRAGTTLIGVGLGLAMLLAFAAGEPGSAVGIGGFVVMLGLAFLANSFLSPARTDLRNGPRIPEMDTPKME
jgi:hypothetical protein